jgi:hypothetical protein
MNLRTLLTLGLFAGAVTATGLSASAQATDAPMNGGPMNRPAVYNSWQPAWDQGQFDRNHVILGTVSNFQPFRLQVARTNGTVQTIDLKNGTRILPRGETPSTNEHVAVIGYYSNGTFIANRVILRDQ